MPMYAHAGAIHRYLLCMFIYFCGGTYIGQNTTWFIDTPVVLYILDTTILFHLLILIFKSQFSPHFSSQLTQLIFLDCTKTTSPTTYNMPESDFGAGYWLTDKQIRELRKRGISVFQFNTSAPYPYSAQQRKARVDKARKMTICSFFQQGRCKFGGIYNLSLSNRGPSLTRS